MWGQGGCDLPADVFRFVFLGRSHADARDVVGGEHGAEDVHDVFGRDVVEVAKHRLKVVTAVDADRAGDEPGELVRRFEPAEDFRLDRDARTGDFTFRDRMFPEVAQDVEESVLHGVQLRRIALERSEEESLTVLKHQVVGPGVGNQLVFNVHGAVHAAGFVVEQEREHAERGVRAG